MSVCYLQALSGYHSKSKCVPAHDRIENSRNQITFSEKKKKKKEKKEKKREKERKMDFFWLNKLHF